MDDVIVGQHKRVSRGSIGVGLAGGVLVVAALLFMSPAFACTVQAGIQSKPGRADPGTVVRIEGSGFEPGGAPVNVYWGGPSTNAVLASVVPQTDAFAVSVAIPANAASGREYLVSAHQDAVGSGFPHDGATIFRTSRAPAVLPPAAVAQPAPATPSPAPAAGAPAPQAAPVPEAAPAPVAAPAQAAAPPAQARRADDPRPSPADASGFSSSGVSAYAPGTQPAAPLVVDQRQAFGQTGHLASGRSPWILVPLGLVGLVLLSAAGASVVRQTRSQGVRAPA